MSLPSDTTHDIADALAHASNQEPRTGGSRNLEQAGLIVAALVAFLGIAYVGPALTRLASKPTLQERMQQRLRETRRQAAKAGGKVRKRVRRLGGGTIWR